MRTLLFLAVCACWLASEGHCAAFSTGARHKRADDPPALQEAFDQLVNRVSSLEAQLAANEAKDAAQDGQLTALEAKRCETGRKNFVPHEHGRDQTSHIAFRQQFSSAPWVAVSLARLDADEHNNLRVDTSVTAVTASGFDATVSEWDDTRLFTITLTWIACSV